MAYDRIEPWGPDRDDYRTAVLASEVRNSTRTRGRGARPLDLMRWFQFGPPEDQADPAILEARMNAWAAQHNAEIERRKKMEAKSRKPGEPCRR